jgi:predicted RecB family nuclease
MKENLNEYQELYKTWTNFTTNMTGKNPTDVNTVGLYKTWKNYTVETNRRINELMKENEKQYTKIYDSWQDYQKSLQKQISTGKETKDTMGIDNGYNWWLDLSNNFQNYILKTLTDSTSENEKLYTTWLNYTEKLGDAMEKLLGKGELNYDEFNNAWTNFSTSFWGDIEKYSSKIDTTYTDLYKTWYNQFESMGQQMTEIMKTFGMDPEKLYQGYFEGPFPFGDFYSLLSPYGHENVKTDVDKLKKKITELEKKIEKIKH